MKEAEVDKSAFFAGPSPKNTVNQGEVVVSSLKLPIFQTFCSKRKGVP